MGILIVSTIGGGAGLMAGKIRINDRDIAWSWAEEVSRVVSLAGHPVASIRGPGPGHCRRRAREIAADANEPAVHLVATVGRPRVVSAEGSATGRAAAEKIGKALGASVSTVEPLGLGVDDWHALQGIGPRGPVNLGAVIVSPVDLELMAEGAEAELGQAIGAAILELLGEPEKAKTKKAKTKKQKPE